MSTNRKNEKKQKLYPNEYDHRHLEYPVRRPGVMYAVKKTPHDIEDRSKLIK